MENTDEAGLKNAAQSIPKDEIKHLHLVSPVAIKLLKLTNDGDTSLDNLSQIIETEPVLAAKILNQVNSAAYPLSNKLTSILLFQNPTLS